VFPRTRYGISVFCLSAAFAVTNIFSGVAFAQGLVGRATDNGMRPRFSSRDVPSSRGRFTFPAPYNTEAVRLTDASDCGGGDCVQPVGYSYWSNINNHTGSDTMLIFLGLKGQGPTLFSYNKNTGETRNRGSLFEGDNRFGWARLSTGEGWYFSATKPNALYINEPVGSRLFRYDVLAHTWETVFDISDRLPGKYIWQVHSSNDDRVHSFTVRDKGNYGYEGCAIYREDQQKVVYWGRKGNDLDECQIDKSGRWLVIKEQLDGINGEDNRVIDVDSNTERPLYDYEGAAGHSDMGYGYLVAEDNFNNQPGAVRVWDFNIELKGGQPTSPVPGQGRLVYQLTDWVPGLAMHVAHSNSKPGVPLDQQMACASNANRENAARVNEIVCFRLNDSLTTLVVAPTLADLNATGGGGEDYWKAPKGNLDITGEYFIWTANAGTGRLDAYIVKIPVSQLGVSASGAPTASSSSNSSSSSSSSNPTPSSSTSNGDATWTGQSGVVLPGDQSGPNAIPPSEVQYVPRTPSAPAPASTPAPAPASNTASGNGVAVQWTSVVNASAMGNTLIKNGGCGGCPDAGAVSVQKIPSGDGHVEFSVPEAGTLRFIGLSSGNSGTDPSEIRFALRLQNGVAEIRELGAYRGEIAFSAGDTLRIAIVGGKVQYSKNGGVFHTSSAAPSYPALVDTTLFDANATIMNVVIKGAR
jgi:hypothetical protein